MPTLIAATLAGSLLLAVQAAEQHPRLLVPDGRLAQVKQAIAEAGSHHAEAFQGIKERVDAKHWYGGKDRETSAKSTSRMACEAACVYLITGEQRYAQTAWQALADWNDPKATSLQQGSAALAFAFAYDWAWTGWSGEQRETARTKLMPLLTSMQKTSKGPPEYNKEAIYNGSEFCLTWALGLEREMAAQLAGAHTQLIAHLERGYGDLGVYPEGGGYAAYAQAFLQPAFAVGRQLAGDAAAKAQAEIMAKRPTWRWLMYAGTFHEGQYRTMLPCGVAAPGNYNEGFASATIDSVPADVLPFYLWWYDRHMGRLARGPISTRYDNDKAASPFALLLYPIKATAKDPTGVLPKAAIDAQMGWCFFRNRWQDADDIQVSVTADSDFSSRGWDQNEALQLTLAAFGSNFLIGPDKRRDQALYSTLWVQDKLSQNGKKHGGRAALDATPTGGYAVCAGGAQYAAGCEKAERHVLVDFVGETGLISTCDDLVGRGANTYVWNAALGEGVQAAAGSDAGRQGFTLSGKGGSVQGWVLHPAEATVEARPGNLRITVAGKDARIWIAMHVAKAKAQAAVAGEGLKSALTVAGRTIAFDEKSGRLRCR